jgi:hypothetical protein
VGRHRVGNALGNTGICTLVPRLVPEELLARVFGAIESVIAVTVAVGALVTQVAVDLVGLRGALEAGEQQPVTTRTWCVEPLHGAPRRGTAP